MLLIAGGVALLTLIVPRLRVSRWTCNLGPLATAIAVAQAILEGPRWQMVPAYVVSGLLLIVRLHSTPGPWALHHRSDCGGGLSACRCPLRYRLFCPVSAFPRRAGSM